MKRLTFFKISGVLFLLVFLLGGCKEKQTSELDDTASKNQAVGQNISVGSEELVKVNGSAITQSELEQTLVRLLGGEAASTLDDEARKKVLESLVMSRAISLARMDEMTDEEKSHLENEVNAYREQLLTRQYIATHGTPRPVSAKDIEEYYTAHPELYGGNEVKKYEMLTCKRALAPAEKDELLQILEQHEKQQDWRKWAEDLSAKGYPVVYRQGQDDEKLLHIKLSRLISDLTPEQKPQMLFIRKIPYLVRLVDVEKTPSQPLEQVSENIRKILAQKQIKEIVEKLSKEVLAKAEVKYVD